MVSGHGFSGATDVCPKAMHAVSSKHGGPCRLRWPCYYTQMAFVPACPPPSAKCFARADMAYLDRDYTYIRNGSPQNLPPPPPTSEPARMDTLPQELVDLVIDQLADQGGSPSQEPTDISQYSTVSRLWVANTQKRHFESVHFEGLGDLQKWYSNIKPDPSGVSRHALKLSWNNAKTLKGFDRHIRAFTHVEEAVLSNCNFWYCPPSVDTFTLMGPSLVRLEIQGSSTKYLMFTSVLAALPHLRHLRAHSLGVYRQFQPIGPPPRIPLFEDANCLDLLVGEHHGPPDWVFPSTRVCDLRVDACCVLEGSELLNKWIASSASSLKFLTITCLKKIAAGAYFNLFSSTSFPITP